MACGHFHSITDYIVSLVASRQHCSVLSSTIQVLMILVLQGLTQVKEILVSAAMPIMSIYRLPHGQYGYSGHVINLPQPPLPAVYHAYYLS
jgi:hypothetical protein